MSDTNPLSPGDRPVPFLALVTALIENPGPLATGVAQTVTLAGLVITLIAASLGTTTGAGLAMLYAGSAWAMCYCLRHKTDQRDDR